MNEWHDDIRSIVKRVSSSEVQGVFLFTDVQIKEESFLEDVSNLLNTGEVPNLFNVEDKNEILEKMRQIDRAKDKSVQTDGSPVALFNMFIMVCFEGELSLNVFIGSLYFSSLFANNFIVFCQCHQLEILLEIEYVNFRLL